MQNYDHHSHDFKNALTVVESRSDRLKRFLAKCIIYRITMMVDNLINPCDIIEFQKVEGSTPIYLIS